eukprot:5687607-Amphidinium_carterae.1
MNAGQGLGIAASVVTAWQSHMLKCNTGAGAWGGACARCIGQVMSLTIVISSKGHASARRIGQVRGSSQKHWSHALSLVRTE